jgi:alanine-glyoxylate transaminase/serine-glyoxylate transaminase/serine-pyruvate transaminase
VTGRPHLAIPGPSVTPDAVLRAMHRTSPDIYEGELLDLTATLYPSLKALAGTRHHAAIYLGNGHAAWEAALANTLSRGDRVLVPSFGVFGQGWATVAQGLGLEPVVIESPGAPDPARIESALRADPAIRAVLAVHTDTSTSLRADLATLRAAIDAAGSGALLMADAMASLGCDPFAMDTLGVDVAMAGSQKGLMTPPGLFFLWINDKALAVRGDLVTPTWDWRPRVQPEAFWRRFFGTAPVQHLYGLRAALDLIEAEGLERVWARHDRLARAVWAAADTWGPPLSLGVPDPKNRSRAVTALRLPRATALRAWTRDHTGVTLGVGLAGDPPENHFRIGHMGHVNAHAILGTLSAIGAGLKALGIPHAPGALDAAERIIAAPEPA